MKKNRLCHRSYRGHVKKLLMLMKLCVLFICVFTLTISANSFAQQELVSFDLKNVTVKELLDEIQKQTNLCFLFNPEQTGKLGKLSLRTDNEIVENVLNRIFDGTELTYKFRDKLIVIMQKESEDDGPEGMRITGKVTDEKGELLPGVTIQVKGTGYGFVTNAKGEFDFDLPVRKDLILIFSFVGFQKQEIPVKNDRKPLSIVLKEDMQEVDEVIVTGIFNKPKESFTGAVTHIKKEELQANYSRSLLQTLSNLDPSFRILANNAQGSNPNVLPEIQLRGASTFADINDLQNSSRATLNLPVFVIDGMEVNLQTVMDMNENEVESINILKDAAATSLYGSRGANGVVVITTTRPKEGKLRVTYRGDLRLQIPDLSSYNLMSAAEKLGIEEIWHYYDAPAWKERHDALRKAVDEGLNFDWMNIPVRTGVGQTHALSLMGGMKEWKFRFDFSYASTVGVMKGSERNNLNATMAIDYMKENKWYIAQRFSVGTNKASDSPYGNYSDYVRMNRYWTPYDENGELIYQYSHPDAEYTIGNPLYDKEKGCWNKLEYSLFRSQTSVRYDILPGFQVSGIFMVSRKFDFANAFIPPSHGRYSGNEPTQKGRFNRSETEENSWSTRAVLAYTKTFKDKHMLTAQISGELAEENRDNMKWSATGFINDKIDHPAMSLGYPDNEAAGGQDVKRRRVSFVSSLNYYYDMRYFFDASYSLDGSSSFGKDSRFSSFWALGAGWTISNEEFIRDNLGVISNMQIRYSYGVSGNMGFRPEDAMTVFSYFMDRSYHGVYGTRVSSFANPNLKWQNTYTHNIGFDLSLWRGRLSFQFNHYNKLTNNTVADILIPISHGFDMMQGNVGKIRNMGTELNVSAFLIRNPRNRMSWSVTTRLAHNKNTIVKMSEGMKEALKYLVTWLDSGRDYRRYIEGKSMDAVYGLRSVGIDPLSGYRVFLDKDGNATLSQSSDDMVYIGERQPKVSGNVNTSFSFKGFTLTAGFHVQWGGVEDNKTLLNKGENIGIAYNLDRRVLTQAWQKVGDQAMFKKQVARADAAYRTTYPNDRFINKNNVFSCNNINLVYNFPSTWLKKHFGMERLSVTAYLSDIFYLTTIERERGTAYPYSINPNFSISCTF